MAHDKGVGGVGMRREDFSVEEYNNIQPDYFHGLGRKSSRNVPRKTVKATLLHLHRRLVGRILHNRRQRLEIRRNNEELRADDAAVINEIINLHQFLLEASDFAQDDTQIIIYWSHS
ncbi:hypothetical protein CRE_15718 [Caenorhabditis remanei]|uniref:Uncharacterized protein n=1 Tax=Caenorhabditis remanei TaxID=31234 RepID=E3NCB2_CAERE|nr:hypothetical protein CRE_15718 [Caenorhabditis remanei]